MHFDPWEKIIIIKKNNTSIFDYDILVKKRNEHPINICIFVNLNSFMCMFNRIRGYLI